ncbi:MAG: hypothetical protein PVI13_04225 [Desulfobacterales bacterium]|jgi:hypothetical protein
MNASDRIYFSNFDVDPEFESLYYYNDLCELDFEANPDSFGNDSDLDDPDDFAWDVF